MEDFQKKYGIWDWDLNTWIDTTVPVSLQTLVGVRNYLNQDANRERYTVQVRMVEIDYKSGR